MKSFFLRHKATVIRLVERGPWAFNNHILIFWRVKPKKALNIVELNNLFIGMHIYNLPTGYRLAKILWIIGTFVKGFLQGDTNNFIGNWKSCKVFALKLIFDVHYNKNLSLPILIKEKDMWKFFSLQVDSNVLFKVWKGRPW